MLIVGASALKPLPEFCSHNNGDANDLDDKSEVAPRSRLHLVRLHCFGRVATGARANAGSSDATRRQGVAQRRTGCATSRQLAASNTSHTEAEVGRAERRELSTGVGRARRKLS